MISPDNEQRTHWEEQGYVVVRGAMSNARVDALNRAVDGILERALAGEYGDDFRWLDEAQRVPEFISDLLSPSKYQPAFGEFFDEVAIPFIEGLIGEPVRCSWLLLLTGGGGYPYAIPLHRDNAAIGTPDEAEWLDTFRAKVCYFQAPLLPDSSLRIVPGSHLRVATDEERAAGEHDGAGGEVEGLVKIDLEPGDVVFRHTNALHDGCNPKGLTRRTMVSAMWADDLPLQPIEWQDHAMLDDAAFVERLPANCRRVVESYLAKHAEAAAAKTS